MFPDSTVCGIGHKKTPWSAQVIDGYKATKNTAFFMISVVKWKEKEKEEKGEQRMFENTLIKKRGGLDDVL